MTKGLMLVKDFKPFGILKFSKLFMFWPNVLKEIPKNASLIFFMLNQKAINITLN